jgi:hypothetical protein
MDGYNGAERKDRRIVDLHVHTSSSSYCSSLTMEEMFETSVRIGEEELVSLVRQVRCRADYLEEVIHLPGAEERCR